MPIWIEALLGLSAIALVALACWREDRLVKWEDELKRRWKNGKRDQDRRPCPRRRRQPGILHAARRAVGGRCNCSQSGRGYHDPRNSAHKI